MTESEKPLHKLWHPLTAAFLIVSAALLIYANFAEGEQRQAPVFRPRFSGEIRTWYGWPMLASNDSSDFVALVIDFLVAAAILASVAIGAGWIIQFGKRFSNPDYKFWQFHFLTVVVAVLLCAWLLHLNCRGSQVLKMRAENEYVWVTVEPGWPFYEIQWHKKASPEETERAHFGSHLIENLAVDSMILLVFVIAFEWFLQFVDRENKLITEPRREARKT